MGGAFFGEVSEFQIVDKALVESTACYDELVSVERTQTMTRCDFRG